MNNVVYYLCYFDEQRGVVFPDELPRNYYSPGLFLVEPQNRGEHYYNYSFDAMDNGKKISLMLIRVNDSNLSSNLYVVKTKNYGSFWFKLETINPRIRYVGKRNQLRSHQGFSVAMSTDSGKLERVCKEHNFYFIGRALRDSEDDYDER